MSQIMRSQLVVARLLGYSPSSGVEKSRAVYEGELLVPPGARILAFKCSARRIFTVWLSASQRIWNKAAEKRRVIFAPTNFTVDDGLLPVYFSRKDELALFVGRDLLISDD